MAKKLTKKRYQPTDDKRTKGKSYKPEMLPFVELNEGESFVGTFQNRRQITIKDRISHEPKDIWIYAFRDSANGQQKFAITGRTMLDQAFEEMIEQEGGLDRIVGCDIRINRGEDQKTGANFNMGTYEVIMLEE